MQYSEIKKYKKGIANSILLVILTCGIYSFFWQKHQIKTVNFLLGKNVLSFWKWSLLSFITCGLYHIYHEYLMGKYIVEIQHKINKPAPSTNLPLIALILSIIGLPLIIDAIEQKELNEIIDYIIENKINING